MSATKPSLAKPLPFSDKELTEEIASKFPTPFHLYDESLIRKQCQRLKSTFSPTCPTYTNYFAVKATPTPAIMKIMKDEGFGADCSSMAELILSERCGFKGEEIIFTSNNTPYDEFRKARELGAIINFDDLSHIECAKHALEGHGGLPELVCFRYNPGPTRTGTRWILDECRYR
jgi:diaminopimelate decarboxylase